MSRYRFTEHAAQDLDEILDFIATQSGPERADAVAEDIFAAAERIAEQPGIGHSRDDLTDESVLFWSVYRYLVVYRPTTRPLEVVRIVHGSRDPLSIRDVLREGDHDA